MARTELAALLPSECGYCGAMIAADAPWVAAHVVDGHPEYGYIHAHRACNERAKRRAGGPRKLDGYPG